MDLELEICVLFWPCRVSFCVFVCMKYQRFIFRIELTERRWHGGTHRTATTKTSSVGRLTERRNTDSTLENWIREQSERKRSYSAAAAAATMSAVTRIPPLVHTHTARTAQSIHRPAMSPVQLDNWLANGPPDHLHQIGCLARRGGLQFERNPAILYRALACLLFVFVFDECVGCPR